MTAADLALPPPAEGTAEVAARVAAARRIQAGRAEAATRGKGGFEAGAGTPSPLNAQAEGA